MWGERLTAAGRELGKRAVGGFDDGAGNEKRRGKTYLWW
jgi:hypothetical protein